MPCRVSSLAPSLQGVWGADVSRLLVADLHEKRIKNRVTTYRCVVSWTYSIFHEVCHQWPWSSITSTGMADMSS